MSEGTKVRYAATILAPREQVYQYWRQWENLPRFSRNLKAVEDLGDGQTRWTAEGPDGDVTWMAKTLADVPNERIAWQSIHDTKVPNEGLVQFADAPGERGTEVVVEMSYEAPFGVFGVLAAKVTGNEPEQAIAETIRRFKAILECGELPTVEGQPSNQMRGDNRPGEASPKVGLR